MIHNISIPWPSNFDTDLHLIDVKGDTIVLNIIVDQLDLTDYKIRVSLNSYGQVIKLGNLTTGGSDDEIVAIDAESGMSAFQVVVAAGLTTNFYHYGTLEIEIEDDGKIFTILQQRVTFLCEKIDWEIPS